jgi:dephospho-CoA kinase
MAHVGRAAPLIAHAALAKVESTREALHAFEVKNARLVEEHTTLRDAYSDAVAKMKEIYQNHYQEIGEKFGEFSVRHRTAVDVDTLIKLLGRDKCEKLNLVSYEAKLSRKNYERAIADGQVTAEVIAAVETHLIPAIHTPKVP